ncbi:hypothetical protein ACFU8Q_11755 [Streptomyces sp. NPDC057543]|uniref:hypothetical protein n=1 Tax=Streptomyces sp. NPDC057543 TaxID=3346163 RepID=UPI0036AA0C29
MKTSRSLDDMIAVSSPRISLMQGSRDWTGADAARPQEWHRNPAPLERPSRSGQLVRLRQQFRREATERRNRRSGDRCLRVLAYSLVPSRSASPDEDWNTLQTEAEQHGYAMGARFHDVAVPVTTTYLPGSGAGRGVYTPPWKRPGWGEVERLIRGGFADGVIVLDRHNISSDDDEYRAVIKGLGERYQAFIHLVIPEEPSGAT